MVRQCFSVVRAQNSKRCNAFFKDSASVFFSDSGQILPTGAKYPPEIHTLIFQALIPKIGLRICFFSRIERLFFCFDSGQILPTRAKYPPEI